jgi:hypothetical protein
LLTLLGLVLYAPGARWFVTLDRQVREKDAIWLVELLSLMIALSATATVL